MRHTPKPLDYVLAALVIAIVLLSTACRQAPTPEPVLEPDTDVPAGPAPQGFPEIAQRLGNGEERIRALAFAPDGETLAVGIYPEARLWSTADGHQLKMIEHRHAVQDITFSPDGSLLAAGQDVYGVQLTRLADDEVLPQLHGGYDSVVAFSPDGTALASGNRQGVVWVWGISDGTVPDNAEPIAVLEAEDAGNLTALAYSSGGSLIAAGHRDGTVHLWDTTSGNLRHSLAPESHYSSAHALTFSPNGEWLAVAGARGDAGHVVRL